MANSTFFTEILFKCSTSWTRLQAHRVPWTAVEDVCTLMIFIIVTEFPRQVAAAKQKKRACLRQWLLTTEHGNECWSRAGKQFVTCSDCMLSKSPEDSATRNSAIHVWFSLRTLNIHIAFQHLSQSTILCILGYVMISTQIMVFFVFLLLCLFLVLFVCLFETAFYCIPLTVLKITL